MKTVKVQDRGIVADGDRKGKDNREVRQDEPFIKTGGTALSGPFFLCYNEEKRKQRAESEN